MEEIDTIYREFCRVLDRYQVDVKVYDEVYAALEKAYDAGRQNGLDECYRLHES